MENQCICNAVQSSVRQPKVLVVLQYQQMSKDKCLQEHCLSHKNISSPYCEPSLNSSWRAHRIHDKKPESPRQVTWCSKKL